MLPFPLLATSRALLRMAHLLSEQRQATTRSVSANEALKNDRTSSHCLTFGGTLHSSVEPSRYEGAQLPRESTGMHTSWLSSSSRQLDGYRQDKQNLKRILHLVLADLLIHPSKSSYPSTSSSRHDDRSLSLSLEATPTERRSKELKEHSFVLPQLSKQLPSFFQGLLLQEIIWRLET